MRDEAIHDEDHECHGHADGAQREQLRKRPVGACLDELGQKRQKQDGELRPPRTKRQLPLKPPPDPFVKLSGMNKPWPTNCNSMASYWSPRNQPAVPGVVKSPNVV